MASPERIPIRTVASLTGVKPVTLRAWERRYGLIEPVRTASGHRLYTHEHVETIRRAMALTARGVPMSRVREAIAPGPAPAPSRPDPWTELLERMATAIARFDEQELDRIQEEALSLHAVDVVTRRLLVPLLARLGERWQELAGAIAEEHFFAMYMRSKLGARLLHDVRRVQGPRLLVACMPGEHHEIGLLLFCIEAAQTGMRPVVLGANMPLADLAAAQRRAACDAIVLSSSVDPHAGVIERELARLVREARVPVFVGGAIATRRRADIAAAGATPVGGHAPEGANLIKASLARQRTGKP